MPNVFSSDRFWKGFGFENLDGEELKKQTSAVNAAIFTIGAGIGYCLIYVFLGFPFVTIAVATYAACSIFNLAYLRWSHNYGQFKIYQLLLISFFPIATQLSIGGFINSSAVGLASFIAPATALLYTKNQTARRYFFLFVALIIGAAIWESYFMDKKVTLPFPVITTFFAITIIGSLAPIYFLMESFLKKQEELRVELRQSLESLRAAQAQLIQQEKMASLGELTAGIAHEIQNPLNFVNNFSEVNLELLEEMKQALQTGDNSDVLNLAGALQQNLEKIDYHGKRADSIVKGMLQHSRKNTGEKFLTDINVLADEYLRLSYHGLRAKDKSFNATMRTAFDASIGLIRVAPQDIGRVLLNLFNNAFYAVHEKMKKSDAGYEPTVSVSTHKRTKAVEICVKDNGMGISKSLQDKIFQPFFTTKPTGQGTGLGLSLSYDIIKAHGGTITVESVEGVSTEFIIGLPLS